MMRLRYLTAAAVCFLVATLVPARASAQSEVVEYYALDAVGSVRVVFDANGAIKSRRDYAPFGEEVSSITADPKMFAGLFRDDESTLDYAQARMYQSGTGRFTAADPVYDGLFAPQKWNRYAYALNNPLTFVDVNGLEPCGLNRWCVETVDEYLRHSGGGGGTDLMYVLEDTKSIGIVDFDVQPTGLPSPPAPVSTPTPPTIPPPTSATNDDQQNPRSCTQRWGFSSTMRGLGGDYVGVAAGVAEIVSPLSLVGDGLAIWAKGKGSLGTKNTYASGLNWLIRRGGQAAAKQGIIKASTWGTATAVGGTVSAIVLAPVGAFTTAYNGTIMVQCGLGVLK